MKLKEWLLKLGTEYVATDLTISVFAGKDKNLIYSGDPLEVLSEMDSVCTPCVSYPVLLAKSVQTGLAVPSLEEEEMELYI